MDNYEATKVVMTKIQALDPENASKIMGYILIQDLGEKEMIRLALGPDTLLASLINQAKTCLGLASSPPPNTTKTSPFLANRPNPFSQTSPRILIPNNNGFHHHLNSPNPSSPSPNSSPWSNAAVFSRNSPRPATYAAVVNGVGSANGGGGGGGNNASGSSSSSLSLPFYSVNSNNNNNNNTTSSDLSDEFVVGNLQVQDQLSFLDESLQHHHHPIMSPSGRSDSMLFPYGNGEDPTTTTTPHHQMMHRRSCSVNDVFLVGGGGNGVEDGGGGFGWRPCMYYARGFCKNGSSCKFLHGGFDSPDGSVGSPSKIDGGGFDEFLRIKAIQQQRLAAASQLMASGAQHPFAYNNKGLNFLNDNHRSAAAALMMGEEFHKFGRFRPDRSNFSSMGLDASANSSARQIYLTFPADSTFKEEDVSNYFSMYGPVQDVRIPYQQKRMFGFVTFVYPETVKQILAKGNPHFVCDSRVLVKPYKEKGKVADKKHHQQQQQLVDRGEFSPCLSPAGFDSREPYDLPFGAGMFYNAQEMMLRRKLEEQSELQQALDLQGRRLMNMQLMDLKNHQNNHHFPPSLSPAIPIPSPHQNHSQISQNLMLLSDGINSEVQEEINTSQEEANSPIVAANEKVTVEATEYSDDNDGSESGNKEENTSLKDSDFCESLEHILPDNLFASPTKFAAERRSSLFAGAALSETTENIPSTDTSSNNISVLPSTSPLGMSTSLKSCNFQMPRFSSGQEAIEM